SGALAAGGVQVSLSEFAITPEMINAPEGGTLVVSNAGGVVHNFSIAGTDIRTKDLQPGEAESISLKEIEPATYTVFCGIPGHEPAGMKGMLHLGSSTGGAAAAAANNEESDAT